MLIRSLLVTNHLQNSGEAASSSRAFLCGILGECIPLNLWEFSSLRCSVDNGRVWLLQWKLFSWSSCETWRKKLEHAHYLPSFIPVCRNEGYGKWSKPRSEDLQGDRVKCFNFGRRNLEFSLLCILYIYSSCKPSKGDELGTRDLLLFFLGDLNNLLQIFFTIITFCKTEGQMWQIERTLMRQHNVTNRKNSHETTHSFKVDHGSRLDNSKYVIYFKITV